MRARFFILLFIFSLSASAQNVTGIVKGILVDSLTVEPLSYGSVVLKKILDGQVLQGLQADEGGVFSLTNVPLGSYELQLSFVGYTSRSIPVRLSSTRPVVDVGVVSLRESTEVLNEIIVAAESSPFTMQADKKIFDADKIEGVAGGSAVDILRQIPMLEVDADDNLQMRGKAVIVTVDGRPSPYPDVQTTMQMLPADVIERVEVVSNPSARYQSEGAGGIVNIVLKKNKVRGYNGAVSASYAPNAQLRGGATLNYRVGKINYFFTANGSQYKRRYDNESARKNLRTDTVYEYADQNTHSSTTSSTGVYKLGFDYFFNDKDAITVSELVNLSDSRSDDAVDMHYRYAPTMQTYRQGDRQNAADNGNASYITEVNFKHQFDPKVEHEWTADARYTRNEYDRNTSYKTEMQRLSLPVDTFYSEELKWQTKSGGVKRDLFLLKSDYIHPIGTVGKFEAGVSANGQWNRTKYDAEMLNNGALPFIPDSTQAEKYRFTEQLYAAYFDFAYTLGNIGYKLGVRAEQSFMDGESLLKNGTKAAVNTPYFYVFPSAFLTYNLGDDRRLSASYSARITRPSFLQLVPYYDVSNLQNIRLGSPNLQPSYTHSAELSFYQFYKKSKNMLNIEAYYSRTQDVIQRIRFMDQVRNYVPDADPDTVTVSQLQNVGRSDVAGATLVFRFKQIKKTTIAATLNGSYSVMQGIRNSEAYKTDLWSGRASLTATYYFPLGFVANLSGRYSLPNVTAQGHSQEYGTVDLSLRRAFFNKTLTATVALYDVFNTYKYVNYSAGDGFESTSERTQNSRQLRFTLMYKFGKLDTESLNRRTKQSVELTPEEAPRGRGL